jgi:YHS domain-containing protein
MQTSLRSITSWLTVVVLAVMAALATPSSVWAKDAPIYTGLFSKVALSGYDSVAYFTENKPVKGDPKFSFDYMGAKWQFSSAENRDKFAASPQNFAPQYGGYCAWAVSQGYTASGDPMFWKIVQGKLYLNFDAAVQKKWETDIAGFIVKANANWPNALGK